jgi:hypothetical protein
MRKPKDLTKVKVKEKIIKLPISRFINSRYRDYAIYVLEQRGIPNFYDALTPVQRFILKNTPTSFVKTLTVVGSVIKDQYHHGDCLNYDTKINLADGTQITIGKWFEQYPEAILLVKSIDDSQNEVIGIAHSPRIGQKTKEYLEIELENGEIIKCTKNHPFYVNGKWIKAKDLKENDDIHTIS